MGGQRQEEPPLGTPLCSGLWLDCCWSLCSLCASAGGGGRSDFLKNEIVGSEFGKSNAGVSTVLVRAQESEAGCFCLGKWVVVVTGV